MGGGVIEVRAPDGRTWWVKRGWIPRYRTLIARWRNRRKGDGSALDWVPDISIGFDDPISAAISIVGLVLFLAVAVLVLIPLLLLVVDLVVAVVVVLLAGIVRVLFRRPWDVLAIHESGGVELDVLHWEVRGFRRAGLARDALADALRSGVDPHRAVLRMLED